MVFILSSSTFRSAMVRFSVSVFYSDTIGVKIQKKVGGAKKMSTPKRSSKRQAEVSNDEVIINFSYKYINHLVCSAYLMPVIRFHFPLTICKYICLHIKSANQANRRLQAKTQETMRRPFKTYASQGLEKNAEMQTAFSFI
jgi:hypothetical protein